VTHDHKLLQAGKNLKLIFTVSARPMRQQGRDGERRQIIASSTRRISKITSETTRQQVRGEFYGTGSAPCRPARLQARCTAASGRSGKETREMAGKRRRPAEHFHEAHHGQSVHDRLSKAAGKKIRQGVGDRAEDAQRRGAKKNRPAAKPSRAGRADFFARWRSGLRHGARLVGNLCRRRIFPIQLPRTTRERGN